MPTFIPYHEIRKQKPSVVVDANHPEGWALSHWRGASQLEELRDDTSLGMVLNALKADHESVHAPYVSNNHFDVDGFLGVWALHEPALALAHETRLREAALIGDFREYHPDRPEADEALKLVAWINQVELEQFYRPFGSTNEVANSVEKYRYFLPRFSEVLQHPERFRATWEPEYQRVHRDWATWADPKLTQVEDHPTLRLRVVQAAHPIHYYALFSDSADCDAIVSVYPHQRYELEYKYTTWVDLAHRQVYPRISLKPLAEQLNTLETQPEGWTCDGIMDTGPLLRLGGEALTKAERFAHPYQRKIHPSSLTPSQWTETVLSFFGQALQNIQPKTRWSWAEIQALQPKW